MHKLVPVQSASQQREFDFVVRKLRMEDDEYHQSTFTPQHIPGNEYFILYYNNEISGFSALEFHDSAVDFWISVIPELRGNRHAFIFSIQTLNQALKCSDIHTIFSDVYIRNFSSLKLHFNIIDKYKGAVHRKSERVVTFNISIEEYKKMSKKAKCIERGR